MSFYRKTLLALFLTSSFLLVLVVIGAYRALSGSVRENYRIRYQSLATTLADTIEKLEKGTDSTMRNALQALRYYAAGREIPSDDKLRVIERSLNISSVEVVNPKGEFIRSTKYKISELPNFFSFCEGYRELFTGGSDFEHTPLMPSIVDNRVLKFALLPTTDRKHVLNVGMEVGYVGDLLRSVMVSDKNIKRLALYTPSGKALGSVMRNGDEIVEDLHPASLSPNKASSSLFGVDGIEISTPVKSTVDYCCECVGKGLAEDASGRFFYMLRTHVSLGDLQGSLGRIIWTLAFVLALALVLAFALSRVIAKKLTARIDRINRKTKELTDLKDVGGRFNFSGTDEISNIGNTMDRLLDSLEAHQRELVGSERSKAFAEMARDVAHNIRSPLLAAENAVPLLQGAPEGARRLVASAVGEIRVLTDNLQALARGTQESNATSGKKMAPPKVEKEEKRSLVHVVSLLEEVLAKKRIEFIRRPGSELEIKSCPDGYSSFVFVQPVEMRVVLSNLINNAVEALPDGKGSVTVSCGGSSEEVIIEVRDSGKGIPANLISTLGQRGVTVGKPEGSGIGLSHAKESIKKWNGKMEISSEESNGTCVKLSLPVAPAPEWFTAWISIPLNGRVVILDDDPLIHELWRRRGLSSEKLGSKMEVAHLSKGAELIEHVRRFGNENITTYLIDYQLTGEEKTGLDLIDELRIAARSVLVTSSFDQEHVQARVRWLGAKMLPKPLLNEVPIKIEELAPF